MSWVQQIPFQRWGRAGGGGGRGRELSCQPSSSFHLTNGTDPKGHILRDGEETPAEIPLVQKLV